MSDTINAAAAALAVTLENLGPPAPDYHPLIPLRIMGMDLTAVRAAIETTVGHPVTDEAMATVNTPHEAVQLAVTAQADAQQP